MTKRIVSTVLIVIFLTGIFFASYKMTLKYLEDNPETTKPVTTVPETSQIVPVTETTTAAPAEFITATAVSMPEDDSWKLLLLNRYYRIDENYIPSLSDAIPGSTVRLDSRVAEAFERMYNAAKDDGVDITPVAGYTSIELQTSLYTNKAAEFTDSGMTQAEASIAAAELILPAGCSEDNVGLSVSIGMQTDSFAVSEAYTWLREHAAEYGFIERYTADKQDITHVIARPWYWRYVGTEAAMEMAASGACLEEYVNKVE